MDGLLKALKEEKENRQEQYNEIQSKISGIEKDQIAVKSERAVWDKIKLIVIGAVIGTIITGLIALAFKYAPQIAKFLLS